MTTKTFPSDSRYYAELTASRSGLTLRGRMVVFKTGGIGSWDFDPNNHRSVIDGTTQNGTWTYDFRNYSSREVYNRTKTVSGAGTYNISGWVEMSGKGRATPNSINITVPPDAPAAPSTPTVTRVSDTNHTVAWTRNATATAPYTQQQVQRREFSGGAWGAWTTVNTISTSYTNSGNHSITDSSTVANRRYQYRINAVNGSGSAASGRSTAALTTPGTPSSVVAEKQPSDDILVTVTQTVPHSNYQTQLEYSMNAGGTWTALTTLNAGVLTYLWVGPPAGSAALVRARVVNNESGAQGNGLTSGWRNSNSVPLTAPPNPPSALAPNGVAFDGDADRLFSWQHNTADSSTQTAYETRYRAVGNPGWTATGKITSGTQSRTYAGGTFDNGTNYEWEVRTWGAHADPSPWSATATFTASTPPSVTITDPDGSDWPSSSVTAVWSFFDPEATAQSAWEARLLDDSDQVLESRSGSGATASVAFNTRLEDATEYTIQVRVRDGSLLWSDWDLVTFTTDFTRPAVPELSLEWEVETGTVMATVVNPAGEIEVEYNTILRSVDEGQTWEEVAQAPVDGVGFDKTAPLGLTEVLYKAVAWTDLPSFSESGVESISTVNAVGYWSAGPDFGLTLQLAVNQGAPPKIDLTEGMYQKVLHYYAGRRLPVETVGEAVQATGSVEFVVKTVEDRDQARVMAMLPAPHLFRLPDGVTLFASIGPVSTVRLAPGWYKVSLPVTEADR